MGNVYSRFPNSDKVQVTNELRMFYTKKVAEIAKVLTKNNLEDVFSETYLLIPLIITLTSTTDAVGRSFSISKE